jgi:hypothetical protein
MARPCTGAATAKLARAEAALSASRLVDLERRRRPGGCDLGHLRAFHRYILGDVYGWASELRTVAISKGSLFCLPQHLASSAADVFGGLAEADRLRGLNREQFIGRVAEFLAECQRAASIPRGKRPHIRPDRLTLAGVLPDPPPGPCLSTREPDRRGESFEQVLEPAWLIPGPVRRHGRLP